MRAVEAELHYVVAAKVTKIRVSTEHKCSDNNMLAVTCLEVLTVTKLNEIFSGRRSRQKIYKIPRFGD